MNKIMDLIINNVKANGASKKDAVANFLLEKKIAMMFFPYLEQLYLPDTISEIYQMKYKDRISKMKAQRKELENINNILNSNNIEFMLVKGMALSQILVDNPFVRDCGDIDILVKKEDMMRCYRAIALLGYKFLEGFDESDTPILSDNPDYLYAEDYHEFPCIKLHEDNSYTIVEVKYATSAISYNFINDFWENSIEINLENISVRTFSVFDTLIHIIGHLYVNSQCEDGYISTKFFRDIIDLKIFLGKYSHIDWTYVLNKMQKYKMIHQAYFALNAINTIWANTVEQSLVNMFNLDKIEYTYNGNENGELWNWKSNIKTRCFEEEQRIAEYGLLYKNSLFNELTNSRMTSLEPCKKLFCRNGIEYFGVLSYDSTSKKAKLLLVYNEQLFREKKIFFSIDIIDNDEKETLIERRVNNLDTHKWNNLSGQWCSYVYDGKGIELICINVDEIFSDTCNEICVSIDSYEKIGKAGYRGTGAKGNIIISA